MKSIRALKLWIVLFLSCAAVNDARAADDIKPKGESDFQRITGDDPEEDRSHWDALYNKKGYLYGVEPSAFLKRFVGVLTRGRALDIAMGEGRNAIFLAKSGFKVDGVDISDTAIRKAQRLAQKNRVSIRAITADLNQYSIKPETYDSIIIINFLSRRLLPEIKKGLKKGGTVLYENSTVEQLKLPSGTGLRRDWLFESGELKKAFEDFEIIHSSEPKTSTEARALLIARKPK